MTAGIRMTEGIRTTAGINDSGAQNDSGAWLPLPLRERVGVRGQGSP